MKPRRALFVSAAISLFFASQDHLFAQLSYGVVAGFDQAVPAATQPKSGVIIGPGGALYGLTQNSNYCGAVYKIFSDGSRQVLHEFAGSFATPPDGCEPVGELVEGPDGLLYGVTRRGGQNVGTLIVSQTGTGTIFRISPQGDGVLYQVLHSFQNDAGNGVFLEGILPAGGLTLNRTHTAFYGTTFYGGTGGPDSNGGGCTVGAGTAGTVYEVPVAGGFNVIHSFDPTSDGCGPTGNLTLASDGALLGTVTAGPFTQNAAYAGSVFRVTPTTFEVMFTFPANNQTGCAYGGAPLSPPVELVTNGTSSLYGANSGCGFAGDPGSGTIYKLTQSGNIWQPTLLHRFTGPDGATPQSVTPGADGNLYGITSAGGASSNGTIFRITPAGDLSSPPLHTFGCADPDCIDIDPNDGFAPQGRLLQASPGLFIGTTQGGNGATIGGSVFSLVLASATSTGLGVSSNAVVFGQSVMLTATVAATAGTPSGGVKFFDEATLLGTATLSGGEATLATSSLAVGTHSISASYDGDDTYLQSNSSAVSVTVAVAATTTTVASVPNPSRPKELVLITATVAPVAPGGGVPGGQVQLLDGKKKLATAILASGIVTFHVSFNGMGTHDLTAVYAGDVNFARSTGALVQTVRR